MKIGKKEINNRIKELVGQSLEPISNSGSVLILEKLDSKNDKITFRKQDGKTVVKKYSYLRIILENLLEFPAINPSQVLGMSPSSLKELMVLLVNIPEINYFKDRANIYITTWGNIHTAGKAQQLPPGDAAKILEKVKKFDALDRKTLLRNLAEVHNSLNLMLKVNDTPGIDELKNLVKQLREFKEESDLIFSNELETSTTDNEWQGHQVDTDKFDEVDLEDETGDDEEQGFDPSKLDIKTVNPTIDLIASRIRYQDIKLDPDFQRNDRIWKESDKSALIESILLKIPIPVFYMSADENDTWLVVDGLQRLTTIYDYMNDKFRLNGLKILSDYNGLAFSEFPRNLSRRIRETEFVVHVIQAGSPQKATTEIFHRINTRGEKLSAQEIRSSLNVGTSTALLRKLAESSEFISATNNNVRPNRMADMEFVLRFCAFYLQKDIYSTNIGQLNTFLSDTMKLLNKESESSDLFHHIELNFKRAMIAARRLFGPYAFRKRVDSNINNHINKALFETWSVILAKLDDDELNKLAEKKGLLQEEFSRLMNNEIHLADWLNEENKDKDFEFSISQSTSKKEMVRYRYMSVENLVWKVINDK